MCATLALSLKHTTKNVLIESIYCLLEWLEVVVEKVRI
jgi:hypothetical protein